MRSLPRPPRTTPARSRCGLYKGGFQPVSRKSPNSLYSLDIASFTMGAEYDQKDARGFINLIGLPMQVRASLKNAPKSEEEMKLWGGRFEEGPSEVFERFSGSLHFDRRLILRGYSGLAGICAGAGERGDFDGCGAGAVGGGVRSTGGGCCEARILRGRYRRRRSHAGDPQAGREGGRAMRRKFTPGAAAMSRYRSMCGCGCAAKSIARWNCWRADAGGCSIVRSAIRRLSFRDTRICGAHSRFCGRTTCSLTLKCSRAISSGCSRRGPG